MDAYGIPVPQYGKAETAEEALEIANRIGYRVSMKIISPDIVQFGIAPLSRVDSIESQLSMDLPEILEADLNPIN